jgi:hypothetical protein
MNNTIKVVEHDNERGIDFVAFAMPEYKEDKRDLFVQYHKACDFFRLACEVVTGVHYD